MATATDFTRNATRPIVLRWDDISDEQQQTIIDRIVHADDGVFYQLALAERAERYGHITDAQLHLRKCAERYAAARRLGFFSDAIVLRIEVLAAKIGMAVVS